MPSESATRAVHAPARDRLKWSNPARSIIHEMRTNVELVTQASSMPTAPALRPERLLLALVSVSGASAACADHGDVATVEVLRA
jgi:hypothetical protein